MPRTLTIAEAAAQLGVSPAAAYAAARNGELPSLRLGKRVLVPRDAFERLLDGHPARELAPASAGGAR